MFQRVAILRQIKEISKKNVPLKKAFWIVNKTDQYTAEIYLYGFIGYEATASASNFAKELNELAKKFLKINIRINSQGGSVYEGIAIRTAIKSCKAIIEFYIDGIAASMAAVLSLSGAKCYMNKYARLMTHRAQGGCHGTAEDLRATADLVDSLDSDLAEIISGKTGLSVD